MEHAQPHSLTLEQRIQAIEDRQMIADVLYRYCRALDRLDGSLLDTVFHSDARLDYGPGIYQGGPGPFIPFALEFQGAMQHTQHKITNLLIDLTGDRAFCESQVCALHTLQREGELFDLIVDARFLDCMSRREGEWRIETRVEIIDFAHERPSTRGWFEHGPEVHRGRHGNDDCLYQALSDWNQRR